MEHREEVAEGSRRWNELVAEWQQLDEQEEQATTGIQWRRGDLLLEVEPIGQDGVTTGALERLRRFGEDVGRELETLRKYRATAAAWPAGTRVPATNFAVHRALHNHPDRFKLIRPGMTYRAAVLAAGQTPHADTRPELLSDKHRQQRAKEALKGLLPEQKAALISEELEEDPEARQQVVAKPSTRAKLAQTENQIDQQQQQTAKERYELAEPRSVQIGAMADAEYGLTKIRTTAEDVSEAVDKLIAYDWPDNTKERVEVLVQRAAAAVELIKARVEGRDLDEELAALLEGGD